MTEEKNLEGLGGWLILVGLGIVLSPLRIVVQVLPTYLEIFSSGTWEALTMPGSGAYHPLWSPILLVEIFTNVLLVLAWVYVAFLFFTRRAVFPKWYIGLMLGTLAFIVLDALAVAVVLPDAPLLDQKTLTELVRSVLVASVWVPYMLVSERVKATFTA